MEGFKDSFAGRPQNIDPNSPQGTSARIKSAFGPDVPQVLIDHVQDRLGQDAQVSKVNQTVGSFVIAAADSSTPNLPVLPRIFDNSSATQYSNGATMHLDSQNRTIILDVPNKPLTTIVLNKAKQGYRVEERAKTTDNMTNDKIKALNNDQNAIISTKNFDVNGKETMSSQMNNFLYSIQKSVSDFFRREKGSAAQIAAMPDGHEKDAAIENLATVAVENVIKQVMGEGNTLSFSDAIKQQLIKDSVAQAQKTWATGTFNTSSFLTWVLNLYDRIIEALDLIQGKLTKISRDSATGQVTRISQINKSTQENPEIVNETSVLNGKYETIKTYQGSPQRLVSENVYEDGKLIQKNIYQQDLIEQEFFDAQGRNFAAIEIKKIDKLGKYTGTQTTFNRDGSSCVLSSHFLSDNPDYQVLDLTYNSKDSKPYVFSLSRDILNIHPNDTPEQIGQAITGLTATLKYGNRFQEMPNGDIISQELYSRIKRSDTLSGDDYENFKAKMIEQIMSEKKEQSKFVSIASPDLSIKTKFDLVSGILRLIAQKQIFFNENLLQ